MTFEEWLTKHHFAQTTRRKALGHVRAVERAIEREVPVPDDKNVRLTLRRYLSYAAQEGIVDPISRAAEFEGLEPLTRLPKEPGPRRKREVRAFNDGEMQALMLEVAGSEDPRDQVLWALGLTGLRVGDVLRTPRENINKALRTGTLELVRKGGNRTPIAMAIPAPWEAMQKGMRREMSENVAAYVADGNENPEADGAAYRRIDRRLKRLAKKLHFEDAEHVRTHQLRRTFAVNALGYTDNVKAVQDALGHKSLNSTLGYVDEANVKKTGQLQRALAGLDDE